MYEGMAVSSSDDLYFLKMFSDYDRCTDEPLKILYEDVNSFYFKELRKILNIEVLYDGEDELKKVSQLKRWAVDYLGFKGKELASRRYDKLDCIEIISIAKSEGYALNCRYISLIFTIILLAAGFKARLVSCMSMDLRDNECHWVTEVYIQKLKKWIVVDVPLDFFYFDQRGNLLNLIEMRRLIISGKELKLFSTNSEHIMFAQQYWKKNIFRFKFILENKHDMLSSNKRDFIVLNPKGFKMEDKIIKSSKNVITSIHYCYNDKYFWEDI